jgi:hypothetical protein
MAQGLIALAALVLMFFCFIAPRWPGAAIRSVPRRVMTGYLPYTALAITAVYIMARGVGDDGENVVLRAMGAPILQLIILRIPWLDNLRFHGACILITMASAFLAPFVIMIPFYLLIFAL